MTARRLPVFVLVLALLASLTTLMVVKRDDASAVAAHGTLVPSTPRTDTPRVLDGAVLDMAQVGDTIIVAGDFTTVSTGTGLPIVQSFLMAYDVNTGEFNQNFRPVVDRPVNIIEPAADGQSFYIGGLFNTIDGTTRRKVAKLDLSGNLVTAFKANASAEVLALALDADDNALYVGGNFASIAGKTRSRLAAVDATTGKVDNTFDYPLSGPVGAGGFMGVKALDVSEDGTQLLSLHSARFIGGQPRTAVALFDISADTAVLRPWSTNHYEDVLPDIGGQLRISDAALSPDGSYLVVVSSGGDRPPTNDSAVKFPTAGGAGVQAEWVSRMFDSIYSVDISDAAVYVGGHFQYQEAPGSTDPFPGDPDENYGFGQGLGPAVLGDEVVRREQIGALNISTGKSLNWSPGANGFHGVTAVRVVDRGLLVGHDGALIGGADIGRQGFFDLNSTEQVADAPETFLVSPRAADILDSVEPVRFEGVATAGQGVSGVQVTVQNLETKQWMRQDNTFGAGWSSVPVSLESPGATTSNWAQIANLEPGTYRVRAKTIDANGVKDSSASTIRFEVKTFTQLPPETGFDGAPILSGNTLTTNGVASDDAGVAGVTVAYYDVDAKQWLQPGNVLGEQFRSYPATLTAPNALETGWTHVQTLPDGNWRVVAKSVDIDGVEDPSTTRTTVAVFPNNELPGITITSPTDVLVGNPGPVTITGTASDDTGVKRVRVLVSDTVSRQGPQNNGFFGNAAWVWVPVDDQGATNTTWSYTIDNLPQGYYRVNAYAADMNDSVTAPADRPRAFVDFGAPGDDRPDTQLIDPRGYKQDFASNEVTITGTATDDNGVARVDVQIYDYNNRTWLHSDGTFGAGFELIEAILDNPGAPSTGFTLPDVFMPNSTYRVIVHAIDNAGQYDRIGGGAYATLAVYPGDADPTIEMNSPVQDEVTGPIISAGGRAFDDIGIDRVQLLIRRVEVNVGQRADGTIGTPQWIDAFITNGGGTFTDWSFNSVELEPGRYYVRSRTVDSVGKVTLNYAQAIVTVQ